jgi:hypothetical protein
MSPSLGWWRICRTSHQPNFQKTNITSSARVAVKSSPMNLMFRYSDKYPIVQSIREGGDTGKPAVLSNDPVTSEAFLKLARSVAQNVAIRNANFEATTVVEVAG